ncbi:MAG: sigma-70 family RNA polymerase sigma factor [Planctomycetota bacterium]
MSRGPRPLLSSDRNASLDDAVLVDRVADGDHASLEVLVLRHGGRVANFLSHLLEDRSWVDDLVQEVFVRLCLRARSYDPRWPLPVWLLRIARNLAVDLMRRERARLRAHRGAAERTRDEVAPAADRHAQDRELGVALGAALRRLPEAFRTAFVLREIEVLHYEEIAAIMGTSEKTVSTRLHRARSRLREILGEYLEP